MVDVIVIVIVVVVVSVAGGDGGILDTRLGALHHISSCPVFTSFVPKTIRRRLCICVGRHTSQRRCRRSSWCWERTVVGAKGGFNRVLIGIILEWITIIMVQ